MSPSEPEVVTPNPTDPPVTSSPSKSPTNEPTRLVSLLSSCLFVFLHCDFLPNYPLLICIKRHNQPSTSPTLSPSSKPSISPSKSPTNKPTPEVCLFHFSFHTLSIPVSHWFTTLSLLCISITNSQRTFPLMLPPQDLLHHLLNRLRRNQRMSLQ